MTLYIHSALSTSVLACSGPAGPIIHIPTSLKPQGVPALSPMGALNTYGNERIAYRLALAIDDPNAWAELAAGEGLIDYIGQDRYQDLDENLLSPQNVSSRFEAELRQRVGPRRDTVAAPLVGRVPNEMKEILELMGLNWKAMRHTGFWRHRHNIDDATSSALNGIFAGTRMLMRQGDTLHKSFDDPHELVFTAHPHNLQDLWWRIIAPNGIEPRLSPITGEHASFSTLLCAAADMIRMGASTGVHVGAGNGPECGSETSHLEDSIFGFCQSHGAAFGTVYDLHHAITHGLPIRALLIGHALCANQGGDFNQDRLGIALIETISASLQIALDEHKIHPNQIDYVNFDGIGFPENNLREALLLKNVLEELNSRRGSQRIKATVLKTLLGDGQRIAGGLELSVLLEALHQQRGPGMLTVGEAHKLQVPADLEEWIDFSDENRDDNIDVMMMLSDVFRGNNISLVLLNLTDEILARYGYSPDERRVYWDRVQERLNRSQRIEEQIRIGDLTYPKFLDWVGFKGRHRVRDVLPTPRREQPVPAVKALAAELSPEAKALRNKLRQHVYGTRLSLPLIETIHRAMADYREKFSRQLYQLDQIAGELNQLDQGELDWALTRLHIVREQLKDADPLASATLPPTLEDLIERPRILEILAALPEVQLALVPPPKIKRIRPKTVDVDAAIALKDRRVTLMAPGYGAFNVQEASKKASALYKKEEAYRRIIDAAHARLSDRYNYDLKKMLFEGTKTELMRFKNHTLVLTSDEIGRATIVMSRLAAAGIPIVAAFGDSAGLLPAAYVAGYFESPADAIEFAYISGQHVDKDDSLGQEDRPMGIALGYDEDEIHELVQEVRKTYGIDVHVTKRNGVGQLVVSSVPPEGIQLVRRLLADRGAHHFYELNTLIPGHHPTFFSGVPEEILDATRGIPSTRRYDHIPLISNATGQVVPKDIDIRLVLARRVSNFVDLVKSTQTAFLLGSNTFLELGPRSTIVDSVATSLGALKEKTGPILATTFCEPEELDSFFAP